MDLVDARRLEILASRWVLGVDPLTSLTATVWYFLDLILETDHADSRQPMTRSSFHRSLARWQAAGRSTRKCQEVAGPTRACVKK